MALKDSTKKPDGSDGDAQPPVKEATPVSPLEPIISFDRWFAAQNRPAHHKAGLEAFAPTKGKKTVTAWNAVFANY